MGTLYDYLNERAGRADKLSRRDDPDTSHAAAVDKAKDGGATRTKAAILAALARRDGQTAGALSESTGIEYPEVWRRCSDLKRDGMVRPDGKAVWAGTGKAQAVLWVVRSEPIEPRQLGLLP